MYERHFQWRLETDWGAIVVHVNIVGICPWYCVTYTIVKMNTQVLFMNLLPYKHAYCV